MNSIVLDASAILAIVNREPGHEKLTPQLLSRAVASTVNVAEAHTKLVKGGWNSDEAWNDQPRLYADLGFALLEKIVFFQRDLKPDDRFPVERLDHENSFLIDVRTPFRSPGATTSPSSTRILVFKVLYVRNA